MQTTLTKQTTQEAPAPPAGISPLSSLTGNTRANGRLAVPAPVVVTPPRAGAYIQEGDAARASLYVKGARLFIRSLFRFFFRVRVIGMDNVPEGPTIICANHLSWADPFLVLCFLPVEPRIYALGYALDYLKDKGAREFRSTVINSLGVMIHLRKDKPVEAMFTMRNVLKRGGSLLIFPEGTFRGSQEGKLMELQRGAAELSQLSGAPLLPVGVTGTKDMWFRRTLTLRIGKPITAETFRGNLRGRVQAMTAQLQSDMQARLPGDFEQARFKLLRKWLTLLFYDEEQFDEPGQATTVAGAGTRS